MATAAIGTLSRSGSKESIVKSCASQFVICAVIISRNVLHNSLETDRTLEYHSLIQGPVSRLNRSWYGVCDLTTAYPPFFINSALRVSISLAGIIILTLRLFKSTRKISPSLRIARLPFSTASGLALKIHGGPDVPDCLPSPIQGSEYFQASSIDSREQSC
jgi:hypothetical protein